MRTDFFLYHGAWIHYRIFGDSKTGYSAKADVSLLKSYPASYVPIDLKVRCATEEEAEVAMIEFCKKFIKENGLVVAEEK